MKETDIVWSYLILSGPKSYERRGAIVSGFGANWANVRTKSWASSGHQPYINGYFSGKLRFAQTAVLPLNQCQIFDQIYNEHYLCARVHQHFPDIPEGTCFGDEGAPLVVDGNTLIAVLTSGSDEDFKALRGGTPANDDHYSFSVALKVHGFHHCSASIIGEEHVITAACCLFDDPMKQVQPILPLQVIVGTNNYENPESSMIEIEVEKFYVPKIYFQEPNKSARNGSIAVLKLKQSLNLSKPDNHLSKLILPNADSFVHNSGRAIVTGFGWDWSTYEHDPLLQTSYSIGNPSGQLRVAEVNFLNLDKCEIHLKTYSNRHLCAQVKRNMPNVPEGTCYGDQGGPLVYGENILIGILIAGSNEFCDEEESPGIYTKVDEYRDFIEKSMNDYEDSEIVSFVMTNDYDDLHNFLILS
ncbi:hypothetical protein QAD02_009319 [Eretmocerus hayati]|uniref:Uncharacterized protein n=1 Tax=Eretmocerus hayati TaxID=131215 RepID=A0ACC2N9B7_9HYME|nr:hypothetical protein QAD02_009319 [Eretmocerus hayati]